MGTSFTQNTSTPYLDGRPTAELRLEASDQGVVFRHGHGPDNCDTLGAREAVVYEEDGVFHLFCDGAGERGWLACISTSKDLIHWERHGPVLDFGAPGSADAAAVASPWVLFKDGWWHMFYLGTPNSTPGPNFVPSFPYITLKARARKLKGPWEKQYEVEPFKPQDRSWTSHTASPGYMIEHGGEFLQFFSAAASAGSNQSHQPEDLTPYSIKRTCGIARTKDLNAPWSIDPEPMLPVDEQIENTSIYYEASHQTWFLFTNHIGIGLDKEGTVTEYTDAIWVYWTKDPNHWNPQNKAVVLDGRNCTWARRNIGMPAVITHAGRLAIFYDAVEGERIGHMGRDIGLAWLDLPLPEPVFADTP